LVDEEEMVALAVGKRRYESEAVDFTFI